MEVPPADAADEVDALLLDGTWSTMRHPVRTNAIEPWPTPVTVVAAGILCFATDPEHDRVYFLLGKERKVLQWGAGSNRWSDFGGGRLRADADAAETAAREFVEETAGCVRYFSHDTERIRTVHEDIAASLRQGHYIVRLETALSPPTTSGAAVAGAVAGATGGGTRLLITYVVQVPWDPRAIMRFQHARALLSGLHKRLIRVPLEPAESEALAPADPTLRTARERFVLYHPAVRKRPRAVPRALLYTDAARDDDETERVPVVESVDSAYLEKEALDLWSIPQLQRGLNYEGILANRDGGVESLRPGFATVLMECLAELRSCDPIRFGEGGMMPYAAVSF